jgi:hypothetical protein
MEVLLVFRNATGGPNVTMSSFTASTTTTTTTTTTEPPSEGFCQMRENCEDVEECRFRVLDYVCLSWAAHLGRWIPALGCSVPPHQFTVDFDPRDKPFRKRELYCECDVVHQAIAMAVRRPEETAPPTPAPATLRFQLVNWLTKLHKYNVRGFWVSAGWVLFTVAFMCAAWLREELARGAARKFLNREQRNALILAKVREMEQLEVMKKRAFTEKLRARGQLYLGGTESAADEKLAILDASGNPTGGEVKEENFTSLAVASQVAPGAALAIGSMLETDADPVVKRSERRPFSLPKPKEKPPILSWRDWGYKIWNRLTWHDFKVVCKAHHTHLCIFYFGTTYVYSQPSKAFVICVALFQDMFFLSMLFFFQLVTVGSAARSIPCISADCEFCAFGVVQVGVCALSGFLAALSSRIFLQFWRGATFDMKARGLDKIQREALYIQKFFAPIQPWKYSPSMRGVLTFTFLVTEMYFLCYAWFGFTTSDYMVITSYPNMVGKVDTGVPYDEQAELDAATRDSFTEGTVQVGLMFEDNSRLFACLVIVVVVYHGLFEVMSICLYLFVDQPTEEDVKKWMLARLVLTYRWIRQTSWYYLLVLKAFILSRLPNLDQDQKQRMYDRSLLLKEFTVDVIYQSFRSCMRCARALLDLCKRPFKKKDPAEARYAAPTAAPREDTPAPKGGVFGKLFGGRRVAPSPERREPAGG